MRLSLTIGVTLALIAGGYTAAAALAPLPAPEVALDVPETEEFTVGGEAVQAIVAAELQPSAVGWQHGGDEVWANDEVPRPIASISKLATVLVALEQQPLEPGADGAIHVWSAEDAALQAEFIARDGVAFPIPIGTEVTQRQMLTLALLPSANDFAAAYANSVFGDNATFVAAVDDWASRYGLESLSLVEPTGMDEGNVATAADVLRLGRLALANPTVAELTRTPVAELPWGIGTVENTNALLTRLPGMLGLKTGRSSVAGYNLVAAQESDVLGRPLVKLAVTLGRDSPEARIESTAGLLAGLDGLPQETLLVETDTQVGTATTVDGHEVPLRTTGAASTVLTPGETATRTVQLGDIGVGDAWQVAGRVTVDAPTGAAEIPIVTAAEIVEPDLWWRLTHPARVFGWA